MPEQTLAQIVRAKHPGAYSTISDAQLEAAVLAKYPGKYDHLPRTQEAQAPAEAAKPSAVRRFGTRFLEATPIPALQEAMREATEKYGYGPTSGLMAIPTFVKNMATGMADLAAQSHREAGDNPHLTAGRFVYNMAAPIVQQGVQDVKEGNYAGAAGTVTGLAAPKMLRVAKTGVLKGADKALGGRFAHAEPDVAASLARMEAEGIPIDLPTASGSIWARQAFEMSKRMMVPNLIGTSQRATGAVREGIDRVARTIPHKGGGAAIDPTDAGAVALNEAQKVPKQAALAADAHYGAARRIQNQHPKSVVVGREQSPILDAQGNPIMRDVVKEMPHPVDLSTAKADVAPYLQQVEGNPAIVGQVNSPGVSALRAVAQGPQHQPLLTTIFRGEGFAGADDTRSALGHLSSNYGDPVNRLQTGKRLIGKARTAIDDAMNTAANEVPGLRTELDAGRKASTKQHAAMRMLGKFNEKAPGEIPTDPAAFYGTVTRPRDASVQPIRRLKVLAPQAIKEVGSAYIAEPLLKDLENGRLALPTLRSKWNGIGRKWKETVYGKAHVQAVDDLLTTVDHLNRSSNASGSGLVVGAMWATMFKFQLPAVALIKVFTNPRAVRFLTRGMKTPMTPSAAEQWATQALWLAAQGDQPEPDRDAEEKTRRAATTARP